MPKKYERDPKSGSDLLIGQMVVRPTSVFRARVKMSIIAALIDILTRHEWLVYAPSKSFAQVV